VQEELEVKDALFNPQMWKVVRAYLKGAFGPTSNGTSVVGTIAKEDFYAVSSTCSDFA